MLSAKLSFTEIPYLLAKNWLRKWICRQPIIKFKPGTKIHQTVSGSLIPSWRYSSLTVL